MMGFQALGLIAIGLMVGLGLTQLLKKNDKVRVSIYDKSTSHRYDISVERIPVKGDYLLLDGFTYQVDKVLFSDNDNPHILLSEELDNFKGEFGDCAGG